MPLGNPTTIENESRIISVTTTTTNDTFTVDGGYKINHINVYRNGVRLVSGNDFLANDASTVQLINSPNIGDVIEFHLFDEFLVNDAIVGAASSQTIYGDLVINGDLYTNNSLVISSSQYADVAGIATVAQNLTGSPDIVVGDITANGDVSIAGTITYENVTDVDVIGGVIVSGVSTFNSDVSIADKIVHIGDTDTAIRFPSPGTFSVDNNGTENLRLTQGGLLEVKGAQFGDNVTPTSGEGIEVFYSTSETGLIQAYDRSNTEWDSLSIKGAPVELYNNNTKVFETADGGVVITGVATATAGTLIAGVGIRTEGSVATAAGAKSIDFRGSGVTTAVFDSSTGISTVYFEGGTGSGGGGAGSGNSILMGMIFG